MDNQERYYAYGDPQPDCFSYTEKDIVEINKDGILLKDNTFINFRICAKNFREKHESSSGKCVAERLLPVYIFYTQPKPTILKFQRKNIISEFFSSRWKRSLALQKKINEYGFRTFDMS